LQVEMAARMNSTYAVLSAVLVMLLGKFLIWVLYGEGFLGALPALMILAPGLIAVTLFGPFNQLLASDGRAAITAWVLAGTAVVVFLVTWFAVPALGLRGAALGALAGNAFMALGAMVICARLYGVRPWRCVMLRRSDLKYTVQALFRT